MADKDLSVTNSSTPASNDHHCIQIPKDSATNNNNVSNSSADGGGRDVVLKPPRLVSLDVFRGLTVALMVLVDQAGGILPSINHAPWNGVTLADFVMPFFLFIVGVALALAYKKLPCRVDATKKAVLRALKLFVFGIVLQGGYLHGVNDLSFGVDILQIRLMGTLQRIAKAYLLTAVCEIWLKGEGVVKSGRSVLKKYKFQWIFVLVLTVTYTALLYGLHVADWEYQIPSENSSFSPNITSVKCGARGDTGPACNAVGMIDRKLFGIQHLYKKPAYTRTKECSMNSPDKGPLPPNAPSWCQAPFDPEGILSSVMAVVTCMIGLHFGHIILHIIKSWTNPAAGLVVAGFVLDFCGMHINKALYSLSYTCVTVGAAGLLFVAIYVMVDVFGFRKSTLVFEWMGKHALVIYILAACNVFPILVQGFYWKEPGNNFLRLIGIGRS
ncbi:heparan-alpha-glucosaminide N-acetyltransferase-like [Papaver somniferum]|uniref:heparan-alpha-glucosaminide N-acetyltransferase-like n=1 Tax=Papaver somniferum TaxID=3469 RepID=UPI000E6FC86E|nr:heparan-alpha-glucosaminide N-acetyltransferase-like [Papaver somniferum]